MAQLCGLDDAHRCRPVLLRFHGRMWYYSPGDRKLRHALYTSSINHNSPPLKHPISKYHKSSTLQSTLSDPPGSQAEPRLNAV